MMARGSALLSVLVIITVGSIIGLGVLSLGSAAESASARSLDRLTARAAAWSGVQAAMAELSAQREALLAGELPVLSPRHEIEKGRGRSLVARLVPLGRPQESVGGEPILAESENAKLDLSRVTAEMLVSACGLEAEVAGAIAGRGGRPWSSVEELATVPGLSLRRLYVGEAGARPRVGGAASPEGSGEANGAGVEEGDRLALVSLLTAFSFDPNVQQGVAGSEEHAGKVRVNINVPWSDELGKAVDERFGAGSAAALKGIMDNKTALDSEESLVGALRVFGVPKDRWPAILDALTTRDDLFVPGRVDLNLASARTLAALPGFTREAAEGVVRERAKLSATQRASITWPLTAGLLTDEQFQQAAGWLTTRSMQWRVRVEAGFESEESPEAELGSRVVFDVVLDVADRTPRVAYMREVTHLGVALAMQERAAAEAARREAESPVEPLVIEEAPPPPASDLGGLDLGSGLDLGRMELDGPEGVSGPASGAEETTGAGGGTMMDRRTGRWKAGGGVR